MLKKTVFIILSLFELCFAQNNEADKTLFTIADDKISIDEFVRVYSKNNINNQADFSQASLEEYLTLYQNFRLKVMEAESLGMDTAQEFKSELANYRKQLTSSYISDRKSTDKLVEEAYQRMQEEIKASHILIFWPNNSPNGTDSLQVKKELEAIKAAALKTSFDAQVQKYGNKNLKKYPNNIQKYEAGPLGYVSVFQTVYPFENALYSTDVGTISNPIATRFGYHLVYVEDKRPARAKMETAHLLVKSKNTDSPENQKIAEEKAIQIYKEIKSGSISFEEAVKKYSEDKRTKFQQGKLPKLNASEMLASFADAAYALKANGDFTKPTRTKIGWHIIKRIDIEKMPSLEMAESDLQKKVKKDSRSNVAKIKIISDTKSKFGFKENSLAINEILDVYDKLYAKNGNKIAKKSSYETTLFTIGEKGYTQNDFVSFVSHKRNPLGVGRDYFEDRYRAFKEQKIIAYREDHLEEIVDEFKFLMQEYHDGILLFELTNEQVWNKAVQDTLGLKNFFEKNRDQYVWKQRIAYTSYTAKDGKSGLKLQKYLDKGKSREWILKKLNKKENYISYETFLAEKESNDLTKSLKAEKAYSFTEKNLDGSIKIIHVDEVLEPSQKELGETRGYVISDYQNFLEKQWIRELKLKYPIRTDQEVFKTLVK